jgi:hypothetical protein
MSTNPNDLVIANPEMGEWGLTKREYFAAMAMQGIISKTGWGEEEAARHAVNCADALINALNNKDHAKP